MFCVTLAITANQMQTQDPVFSSLLQSYSRPLAVLQLPYCSGPSVPSLAYAHF